MAIDLVIYNKKNRVLLGLRKNPPAKDFWFVPGGRVRKNETLKNALRRVLKDEVKGCATGQPEFLGVTEHFYDHSFFGTEISTHYVVIAFRLRGQSKKKLLENTRGQHIEWKWWVLKSAVQNPHVHPYTKCYLKKTHLFR